MAVDKDLVKFIVEARERGFSDSEIRTPLMQRGWKKEDVDAGFIYIRGHEQGKERVHVHVPLDVLKVIQKRARKNMLSVEEQIEDILRRSAITGKLKKVLGPEKIDDLLVSIFSRRKRKKK